MIVLANRPPTAAPTRLAPMIAALGTDRFQDEALSYLNGTSGVEHFTMYRMGAAKPQLLAAGSVWGSHALWGRRMSARVGERSYADLFAAAGAAGASQGPVVVQDDVNEQDDGVLRFAFAHFEVVDRVMVCGGGMTDTYAISLLRSQDSGPFRDEDLEHLTASADVLIAACAKHADLGRPEGLAARGFGSVACIEEKLRTGNLRLARREAQVAARMIFGISTAGVAIDLGLAETSIATYRKRLYARLKISSRHELVQRYLQLL